MIYSLAWHYVESYSITSVRVCCTLFILYHGLLFDLSIELQATTPHQLTLQRTFSVPWKSLQILLNFLCFMRWREERTSWALLLNFIIIFILGISETQGQWLSCCRGSQLTSKGGFLASSILGKLPRFQSLVQVELKCYDFCFTMVISSDWDVPFPPIHYSLILNIKMIISRTIS